MELNCVDNPRLTIRTMSSIGLLTNTPTAVISGDKELFSPAALISLTFRLLGAKTKPM